MSVLLLAVPFIYLYIMYNSALRIESVAMLAASMVCLGYIVYATEAE